MASGEQELETALYGEASDDLAYKTIGSISIIAPARRASTYHWLTVSPKFKRLKSLPQFFSLQQANFRSAVPTDELRVAPG